MESMEHLVQIVAQFIETAIQALVNGSPVTRDRFRRP
jgi:hypothetical protein